MTPGDSGKRNYTRCYRAISNAEYHDILASSVLRPGFNTLEGNWFADTLLGAIAHGNALYPDGDFRVIEVDIPNDVPSLSTRTNLDGFGPARFVHGDDLPHLKLRALEIDK